MPLPGKYSYQTGIVNFAPDQILAADTTYEVIVPAGGVRDVSGNPIVQEFRSTFTTGQSAGASLLCEVALPPTAADRPGADARRAGSWPAKAHFTYDWEFGDGSPLVSSGCVASELARVRCPGPLHRTQRSFRRSEAQTSCAALVSVHTPVLSGVCTGRLIHHPGPLRHTGLERESGQRHRHRHQRRQPAEDA